MSEKPQALTPAEEAHRDSRLEVSDVPPKVIRPELEAQPTVEYPESGPMIIKKPEIDVTKYPDPMINDIVEEHLNEVKGDSMSESPTFRDDTCLDISDIAAAELGRSVLDSVNAEQYLRDMQDAGADLETIGD